MGLATKTEFSRLEGQELDTPYNGMSIRLESCHATRIPAKENLHFTIIYLPPARIRQETVPLLIQ